MLVAAEELVQLLMLDSDTPDQAFAYVDATGDAKLEKIVALAAKDVAALTEGESLELGDWYHSQTIKAGKLAELHGLESGQEPAINISWMFTPIRTPTA